MVEVVVFSGDSICHRLFDSCRCWEATGYFLPDPDCPTHVDTPWEACWRSATQKFLMSHWPGRVSVCSCVRLHFVNSPLLPFQTYVVLCQQGRPCLFVHNDLRGRALHAKSTLLRRIGKREWHWRIQSGKLQFVTQDQYKNQYKKRDSIIACRILCRLKRESTKTPKKH